MGDSPFMLSDHLYVPDADAAWAKALAAGCTVGDPFGFVWAIASQIEVLGPEELAERQKKMFGG